MPSEPTKWQDITVDNPAYFETGPPPVGYPGPIPTPDSLRRGAGAPPAPGTPHATAVRFLLGHIRDEDARLVHGTIAPEGIAHAHAWVELAGDVVWDGATRRFYDRADWSAGLHPTPERRYTRPEAARLLLTTADPGPWPDHDSR
ncbi:MAG TPA: hypothetical protein VD767_05555 [Thermomicrobiales bacterium]|nr:hypothetical protein [Thermomicrobiales bacterium]